MPVLPAATPLLKQFYLPSTAFADGKAVPQELQAWVKLDMSRMSTGDLLALQDTDTNGQKRTARILLSRIKEWNFTEPDGSPADINFENLMRMDYDDFVYLTHQKLGDEPQELSLAEKKS